MEDNKIKTCGTLTEIEKYDPNLTREWNSIITKENLKEIPSRYKLLILIKYL